MEIEASRASVAPPRPRGVLYPLFPNTVLAYTEDHCGVFTSFPVSPDESLINVSVLVDPEVQATGRKATGRPTGAVLAALDEDFTVGADIQCELPQRRQPGPDLRQVREGVGWYHQDGRRRFWQNQLPADPPSRMSKGGRGSPDRGVR